MAAVFPWIFPSSHPSCTFIIHVLINRTSWNVILDDRTHFLIFISFSRGDIPHWPTSPSLYSHSLLVKFKVLCLPYYWSIVEPLSLLGHNLRPNMYLGLHPYNSLSKLWFSPLILGEKWGFDVWIINPTCSFDFHMWECRFACPITVLDTSEPTMFH